MIIWSGIGLFLTLLAGGCAAFAALMLFRLAPPDQAAGQRRWLLRWGLQGLLTPALIWLLMNVGLSFDLDCFIPDLQQARGSPLWLPKFCFYAGAGLAVVASYWGALTLGWLLWRTGRPLQGEVRKDFRGLCLMSLGGMSLPALLILWLGGWLGVGVAGMALLAPIAGYAPALLRPARMPPLYARAIARMKFGKYSEAEEEVLKQLEQREDDFQGWVMLAELYANHFNDLPEAEQTILEICDQPRTTPVQVSVALHKLADWHLKLREDPEAARRALEVIAQRMPGTHLARMARLRAQQLPRTTEELREQQVNKPVYLPTLHDPLDLEKPGAELVAPTNPADARRRAAQLEARIQADPADLAPREELARLYVNGLGQPERGILEARKLLALADQLPEKRAAWMGLIATWQIEKMGDRRAGRETLRQIIQEFPQSSTAFAAQRRLTHLDQSERPNLKAPPPIPRFRIEADSSGKTSGGMEGRD